MKHYLKYSLLILLTICLTSCKEWERSHKDDKIEELQSKIQTLKDSIENLKTKDRLLNSKFVAYPLDTNNPEDQEYQFVIHSVGKLPEFKFYAMDSLYNSTLLLDNRTSPIFKYTPKFKAEDTKLNFHAEFNVNDEIIFMPISITKE